MLDDTQLQTGSLQARPTLSILSTDSRLRQAKSLDPLALIRSSQSPLLSAENVPERNQSSLKSLVTPSTSNACLF